MRIPLQESRSNLSTYERSHAPVIGPKGKELEALNQSPLKERFYSWIGVSGNMYVCTVFSVGEENTIANLPNTIVVGVERNGDQRQIVCFGRAKDFRKCRDFDLKNSLATRDVSEWHVHFATDFTKFCEDLSATVRN